MTIIIIHIQKYDVTTQDIKLSKMPLFYEIKNFIKLTLKKKRKNISLESIYKKPTAGIVIKPCFMS